MIRAAVAIAALVAAGIGVWVLVDESEEPRGRIARLRDATAALPPQDRWLAPGSFFNQSVPADAPIDPRSPKIVERLATEARRSSTINYAEWSTPVYRVPANQPRVRVQLDARSAPELQQQLAQVPLPPHAKAAAGTDGNVVVVQEATDTAWEFWRLRRDTAGRTRAGWAGVARPLSSHPGVFRDVRAPDGTWGEREFWGVTASKLVKLGGLITARELAERSIPHALAIATPNPRAELYALPARGTDGDDPRASAVPEGAQLRLDPRLDLSSLDMPPLTRALARAAQRFGLVVNNRTGSTVAFYAEDPKGLPVNPYPSLFAQHSPQEVAEAFPWQHIQLLQMELRRMR